MTKQSSFTLEELQQCGHGEMFGEGNARLPIDNMLMMDRITHISDTDGEHGKGTMNIHGWAYIAIAQGSQSDKAEVKEYIAEFWINVRVNPGISSRIVGIEQQVDHGPAKT